MIGWIIPIGGSFFITMSSNAYLVLVVLRAARLIRVFKTLGSLKSVQAIQTIVQTLYLSLPALKTILMLFFIIGCMFLVPCNPCSSIDFYTVISVFMFGPIDKENFGNLAYSARVYLQVSCLDIWSAIYFKSKSQAREMFPVLVSYIIIQDFVLLK